MADTRVLAVDGQPIGGASLHLLIAEQTGYDTAACTLDDDVITCTEEFNPRIVVITLHQPTLAAALQVCHAVADQPGEPMVLLLATSAMLADQALSAEAFEAGAAGILNRDTLQVEELIAALKELAAGQPLWDTRAVQQALKERKAAMSEVMDTVQTIENLTPREREVFAMMAEGASNGAIAQRLDISERTAQGHVSNILAKLGVHSRAEAIAAYYRAQQVAPDPSLLDEQA